MIQLRVATILVFLALLSAGSCTKGETKATDTQGNSPTPAVLSDASNVVVVCSSCAYPGLPREGHLILMDSRTGQIWAYSDEAMVGRTAPTYVGTLDAVGKTVRREPPQ